MLTKKNVVGFLGIILVHFCLLLLIIGYVYVASSTEIDNLFHIHYEPSGMQMLYYYFTLPIFVFLSCLSYFICQIFKFKKNNAFIILSIWFMFWIFIVFMDEVLHFPRNKLFYWGSLFIALISLILLTYSAFSQVQQIMKLNKNK